MDRSDLKGADFQHLGDTQALWTCEGKIWLADHAELDDRKALRSANHVAAAGVIDDRWGFGLAIGDQGHDVRLTHGLSHRDFPFGCSPEGIPGKRVFSESPWADRGIKM